MSVAEVTEGRVRWSGKGGKGSEDVAKGICWGSEGEHQARPYGIFVGTANFGQVDAGSVMR